MIYIRNLTKTYGKTTILDKINLEIKEGVYGLLGENGAGKTTLMRILSTLLIYDCGSVEVYNNLIPKDKQQIRKFLGYLPQHFDFFPNITVFNAMDYFAELKDISKGNKRKDEIMTLLEQVNLKSEMNKKIKQLSGGMKQRLGIAQALLGSPKLIVFDEPTVGLDPGERLSFRNLINEIGEDKIIILSTHIITDISSSCESLAILKKGSIVYSGYIDNLLREVEGKVYTIEVDKKEVKNLMKVVNILSIQRKKENVEVRFLAMELPQKYINAVNINPTLEDAYFYKSYFNLKRM